MIKNKIIYIFLKPGSFFRYQRKFLRKFYHYLSRYLHFFTFYKRSYKINKKYKTDKQIDLKKGFIFFRNHEFSKDDLNLIYNEIENKIKFKNIKFENFNNDKSIFTVLDINDFDRNSLIYKFIFQKKILYPIINYLKCVPLLSYVAVWYSPNQQNIKDSSQFFHLDHEDYKQIKGFLMLDDVDLDCGPFTLVNKLDSDYICNKIKYRMTDSTKRIDDEFILKNCNEKSINVITGNKGDLSLVDTSSCLHYGSRKASKPRYLLVFQFITPYAYILPWFWRFSKKTNNLKFEGKKYNLFNQIMGKKV